MAQSDSFVEIDQEVFSTVMLSIPPSQEGQLPVSGERLCTSTGKPNLPRKIVVRYTLTGST